MLAVIIGTGLVAGTCGLVLIKLVGPVMLWPMLAGSFFLLFYTWPLKLMGLGEPSVLLVWGPIMVGGTYLALSGHWSWAVAAIGAVYAIGPTTVLFGKHTDKLLEDKAKHIHTLPVVLGEKLARYSVVAMLVAQPILVVLLVLLGVLQWPMLVVLLAIPRIIDTIKVFLRARPKERPSDYPASAWPLYLVSYAFRCNRVTGGLFVLGLLLSFGLKLTSLAS